MIDCRGRRIRMSPPWEQRPHHRISSHAGEPLAATPGSSNAGGHGQRQCSSRRRRAARRRRVCGCSSSRSAAGGHFSTRWRLYRVLTLTVRALAARSTARRLRACACAECCTCTRRTRAEGGASSPSPTSMGSPLHVRPLRDTPCTAPTSWDALAMDVGAVHGTARRRTSGRWPPHRSRRERH